MRILLIEDEKELLELLCFSLSNEFIVDGVSNALDAQAYINAFSYSVVVMDRNLGGIDSAAKLVAYSKQKNPNCPVLILSAMSTVDDKVDGLEFGADDYLEKPFDIKELKARIYALSRRFQKDFLHFGTITVEPQTKIITKNGQPIALTKNESALFFYLLSKRGEILSREEIMDAIYDDPTSITQNAIDELVSRIRKKLTPQIIKTVKTRGFCIE